MSQPNQPWPPGPPPEPGQRPVPGEPSGYAQNSPEGQSYWQQPPAGAYPPAPYGQAGPSPYPPGQYAPQQYGPQQYGTQHYPGQGWNVPVPTKRPAWKVVLGTVLAVWTGLALLSTLSRLGSTIAGASGQGVAYQVGMLIGTAIGIVLPGVLAWILLRRKP